MKRTKILKKKIIPTYAINAHVGIKSELQNFTQ